MKFGWSFVSQLFTPLILLATLMVSTPVFAEFSASAPVAVQVANVAWKPYLKIPLVIKGVITKVRFRSMSGQEIKSCDLDNGGRCNVNVPQGYYYISAEIPGEPQSTITIVQFLASTAVLRLFNRLTNVAVLSTIK